VKWEVVFPEQLKGLRAHLYPSHTELRLTATTATSNRRQSPYVAAWSPLDRRLAVTPKLRSQRIVVFLHCTRNANRPTLQRLYTASILRLYGDLRRPTATAFAVRSFIVAVRSICGRSTDRIVAVQSQYTRASAGRQQTDRTAIEKSPQGILNSSKFLSDLQRPYGDQCDRPRPHCDRTGTLLRSAAIWSKNWSQ